MLYQATTKVPGGKMINVKVEADAVINAIRINGDFFLHPEEAIPEIEKSLVGQAIPSEGPAANPQAGIDPLEAHYASLVHAALAREKAAFLGVTPEDIARTITAAFRNPQANP